MTSLLLTNTRPSCVAHSGYVAKINTVSSEKLHACTAFIIINIRPTGSACCVNLNYHSYVKNYTYFQSGGFHKCGQKKPAFFWDITQRVMNGYTIKRSAMMLQSAKCGARVFPQWCTSLMRTMFSCRIFTTSISKEAG
jgi:hypothetical protein